MNTPTNPVTITAAAYKGFESVVIESAQIRLETVPEIGGKLVSLIYKPAGKEWLLDSGLRLVRKPEYGTSFGEWDMSGWDECFPTINSCHWDEDGTAEISDHGEIWPLPWDCRISAGSIVSSVRNPRFPFRFTRAVSCPSAERVRFDYKVDNLGERPMPFLWVPHPQFAITEPTRVVIPQSMKEMLCVYGGHSLNTGEFYPWDQLSLIAPEVTGDGKKLYYPDKAEQGCSGLYGEHSGDFLCLRVPPDKVPYLGVWVDEGMFNDRVTCALEPGIGYYDSLDTAISNGTAGLIPPHSFFSWHMELTLGNGMDNLTKLYK
ncbi:hypothetical protein [Paenibacillus sp. DMB5]|uniref:hypothetical protein n=1 Tax=Paenibacillus sp. DMB5 TaxID=1780103 RepID=UPI00076C1F95|nr:hypothetical protein [Paenibacillus sp. DMB5]KUP21756.1 hypothetical protein AWJ19_02080 [Paenibacillus sp. DMB5]